MGAQQQILLAAASTGTPPIPVDWMIRFASGTAGTLITNTLLTTNTLGVSTGWIYSDDPSGHTNIADFTPIPLPTPLSCASTTVSSVSKGPDFDLDEAAGEGYVPDSFQLNQSGNFPSGLTEFACFYIIKPNSPDGTNNVGFDILSLAGGGFGVPQVVVEGLGGPMYALCHSSVETGTLRITLQTTGTYMISAMFSESEGKMFVEVYDMDAEVSLGATTEEFTSTGLEYVQFQDYLLTSNSGGGNLTVPLAGFRDDIDVFPFRSNYVVPTPSSLDRDQLGLDEITLTAVILAPQFTVFKSVDGGSYSQLGGTYNTFDYANSDYIEDGITFVDNTVSDGEVLLYRIYAVTRSYTSALGQFASITVDNGPFVGGSPIVTAYPTGFAHTVPAGFKFTWNNPDSTVTELGFVPSTGTVTANVVVTLRADSGGTVLGTVTITAPYVAGTLKYAALMTPAAITNGTRYRLTIDSISGGEDAQGAVGVGGFTFISGIGSPADCAPDGSSTALSFFTNLLYTTP